MKGINNQPSGLTPQGGGYPRGSSQLLEGSYSISLTELSFLLG